MMKIDLIAIERVEQELWTRLWHAIDDGSKAQLGISQKDFLDASCIFTKAVPDWFFNRVIGLGLEQQLTESDIDKLIAFYHENETPIGIAVYPHSASNEITGWLEKRNFKIANQWYKMVRDNSPTKRVKTEFDFEVAKPEQRELVADMIAKGFGLPDILKPVFAAFMEIKDNRVYIAKDGDTAIGVASLTVIDGTGHLNTATTLAEYRGRGVQGAIMAKRIEEGIKLGCKNFVTETWVPGDDPNHSYNNMLRHGFECAYIKSNQVLQNTE